MALMGMGYTKAEASTAIERCGVYTNYVTLLILNFLVHIYFDNYL